MRIRVGRTEQIAQKTYFCDCCCRYIMPGETYSRSISINKKTQKATVFREHVFPHCEPPWEDPDSDESRFERQINAKIKRENFSITKKREEKVA